MSEKIDVFGSIQETRRHKILSMFGVNPQPESIEKSISEDVADDESFEVYDNDVQKSDILRAVSNCDNPLKMKKTGKEIKDQITSVVLPEKQAALAEKKVKLENLLEDCGTAPTACIPTWWTGEIKIDDIPFKMYNWDETYYRDASQSLSVFGSLSLYDQESKAVQIKKNYPTSVEQAQAREKYNEVLHVYCEILTDIKACEILDKNIKDNETIELTARQIMAFGFDK